jgi:hypothetical protein
MLVDAFDEDAFLVRRSVRLLGGAATLVVLGAALAWALGYVALGCWVAWIGLGGLAYGWGRSPGGAPRAVRVGAGLEGLSIDGTPAMTAGQIVGGWIQPRPRAAPLVHVRGRFGRQIRIAVRDADQGRELLRALGIDASQVSAHYWAMARPLGEPRAFAQAGLLLALTVALGLLAGPAAAPTFAVGLVALIVMFAGFIVPTRVVVGGDGVLLRWLGTIRFVPWSRVTDIERFDGGVMLALGREPGREGGREVWRQGWLTLRMPEDHERYQPERDAMVERMLAAHRAHGPAHEVPMARELGKAGARTRDWVRSMRALLRSAPGFRTAAIPVDRLWQVVEDPRADREARTGAAIALATHAQDDGRERIRIAAAGCAEPRLRIALRTAATEARAPDDVLAEALDALESEGEDDARPTQA